MAITRDDVRRVAALARLHLEPGDEARAAVDLDHILDAFATLASLETSGVEVWRPLDVPGAPLREDAATNPEADEALLANAPDPHGRLFHVPKIIE